MAHHSQWGPSGLIVEQIIRRAATLTDEEGTRLFEAWCELPETVDEVWGVVVHAERTSGRDATRIARDVMDVAPVAEGATAVRDAAYAAALCDLVGQHGLTAEHIDALMGPWLAVVGDPRIAPVCYCDSPPVTLDLGPLAPQPGDRCPWLVLVLDPAEPEPLIVGYAATPDDALALADKIAGPVIIWRAWKGDHDRWGPNGLAVEQVVRRAATMSADECRRLASAWDAWTSPDPADTPLDFGDTDPWQAASDEWNDAEEALDRAVTAAGRAEEARDAGRAGWDAVKHTDPAGRLAAPLAADTAATAAAATDLVGTEGFTAAHLDLLLGPWRAVFGEAL